MKHFIKRLLGFSMGPVLGALISLIQGPLFASLMPVAAKGNADTFQQLLLQIPNFIYLGLDQAYSREYHIYKDKRNLMQMATLVPMAFALVLFVVMIVFADPISLWLFKDSRYSFLVWYSGIWTLSAVLERFILMTIRMEEKAIEYSSFNLLIKIGTFAVSLVLIFMGMTDFTLIIYGLIFGQLGADLILFVRYRHLLDLSQFQVDWLVVGQMVKFGMPLMLSTGIVSALKVMDLTFLTSFSTPFDRGIYGHAAKLAALFGIVKTAFASFWVPTAFRWHKEGKEIKHYQYISEALLFVLTGVFFALLFLKGPIMWAFSGGKAEYMQAQYVLALLCFPHIMYTLSETTTLGIAFSRKTIYNVWVSFLAIIPSVLLNAILTPTWGYRGAAFAGTAAYIVFYLARTYFSRRTGFYFPQSKQVISTLLMLSAGLLNVFDFPYLLWITLAISFLALYIQRSTIIKTFEIKAHPEAWDFS